MLLARRANEQKHIFSNIPSYIGPKFKANLKSENRTNYLVILLSDTYHTVFQLILLRLVCYGYGLLPILSVLSVHCIQGPVLQEDLE